MSGGRSSSRLKVVFDTNVYFSAFNSKRGASFNVWRRAVRGEFTLIVSPEIMRELAEVLRLDLETSEPEIVALLKLIAKVANVVQPGEALAAVKADPDDDRILECAVEGKADLIISFDRHLLDLKSFQGIGVVTPVDLLHTLGD
jgi:putative PIN family toxin of toxin-antitoxin system